jgi:hypothetical protein
MSLRRVSCFVVCFCHGCENATVAPGGDSFLHDEQQLLLACGARRRHSDASIRRSSGALILRRRIAGLAYGAELGAAARERRHALSTLMAANSAPMLKNGRSRARYSPDTTTAACEMQLGRRRPGTREMLIAPAKRPSFSRRPPKGILEGILSRVPGHRRSRIAPANGTPGLPSVSGSSARARCEPRRIERFRLARCKMSPSG